MTKKVYLDANILISHQVSGHEFHQRAKNIIDDLWEKGYTFVISSLTMDEFWYGILFLLRSLDKKKRVLSTSYADTLEKATAAVLSWEKVELVEFHNTNEELGLVLKVIMNYHLAPRDALHLQIIRQQDVSTLATFDRDFYFISSKENLTIIH